MARKKKKASQFGENIEETLRYLDQMLAEQMKVHDKKELNDSMKLIHCTECDDIVALHRKKPRSCLCGRSSGFYTGENDWDAKISGPCIPIGFCSRDFSKALRSQPEAGWGVRFEAFVIPKKVASIQAEDKKK